MRALSLTIIPLLLLAGLLLSRLRAVRLAVAGSVLAALATASAGLVLGDGSAAELAGRIAERGVQPDYLLLNAAILLAGLALGVVAIIDDGRSGRPLGMGAMALALVTAAVSAWPLVGRSRPLVASLIAATIVLLLLAWLAWSEGRARARGATGAGVWFAGWSPRLRWGVAALAAAAALAPDLRATLLLVVVLAIVLYVRGPRGGRLDRLPAMPVAALAVLAAAGLVWRAAGAESLATATLRDAPFSPALQTLLGVLLLPSLFALAGVPPFDRFVPGAALAPVSAAIMARGVLPGLADGVEHWRSALALWLVLAAADAVRRRREALVAACASLFALVVGGEPAVVPGMALAIVASLVDVLSSRGHAVPAWAVRAALGVAAAAWAFALRAGLATEVVYSVAMAMLLAAGVLRGAGRPAER